MDNKDFTNKLQDPKFFDEFTNHVVISKLIADELAKDNSYQHVVNLADELGMQVNEVHAYLQLFNYMQKQLIL